MKFGFQFCAVLTLTLLSQCSPGVAQDSVDAAPSASVPALQVPRGNALDSLFTPQPQYPTAQTQMNPQPAAPAAGELNPLKGLFTPQPQYATPQATRNPEGVTPDGEVNHLKGVFTPPNQFATPQTVLNPHAVPNNFVPERQLLWGTEEQRTNLIQLHNLNTFGTPNPEARMNQNSQAALQQQQQQQQQGTQPSAQPGSKPVNASPRQQTATQSRQTGNALQGQQAPTQTRQTISAPLAKPNTVSADNRISDDKKALAQSQDGRAQVPLRDALSALRSGKYNDVIRFCDDALNRNVNDAQAHYLKAVALVSQHHFTEASDEYNKVLSISANDSLSDLARAGLKKLAN